MGLCNLSTHCVGETSVNAKEAREIISFFPKEKLHMIPIDKYSMAKGFLDCDAQWKEKVKPLVEALEEITWNHANAQIIASKALSHWRKSMGEE